MTTQQIIRILVASPSLDGASKMAHMIAGFPEFRVVDTATSLAAVVEALERVNPNLILLSQRFRGSPEFEVLLAILRDNDIRWLELASRRAAPDDAHQTKAPLAGLFEVDATTSPEIFANHIKSVCRNLHAPSPAHSPAQDLTQGHPLDGKILLIGASTGGVECLIKVLANFTSQCPPTLIVQHTGDKFLPSLISLLNRRCPVPVRSAQPGEIVNSGHVVVAGQGGMHLELTSNRPATCALSARAAVTGHRPSVDALFQSAVPFAKNIVAALLTGMGRDGAEGLLALQRAGATTMAQDEETSIVYGMPRAAAELDAADHVLGISTIAQVLSGQKRLPISHQRAM